MEKCSHGQEIRTTKRDEKEKKELMNRLKRIEGQVRGIQKMIEDDRYCVDILIQMSAIQAALKKVGFQLLERHTNHCVREAIEAGTGDEAIKELMEVFKQFSK
ncbi:DNA-binding FrmR family transcriptional regulator [Thermolongibacillus altinsuensis]|jgi:DNA-binding FrmR family transcriptional regulator|uniref:DNA-binding FrmR family transcriptional regulator n=1 Tax=Thermolongibacillus altinsuensis TaxID=575256 RepID=A0A4V2QAA0_9BACL|nr:metal-sensing transcriptional repressor [Thermolongibacillus altinsuensis]TCL49786.1 DNA-binding FrmR family transcriptional regulator [Thermolongibacillus altinsuensis]GMB08271.1 transcriptional regulator [Thermolongibacillus altinsuensis]